MSQPLITLNDGNQIPQLGLGVWKASDGEEVENAVKSAISSGYRLIDTAMVYQNETGVGNAIRDSGVPREELFVTTKLWNSDQGKDKVRPALEASLKRLGLDYIDMYLIHWAMPSVGLYVETWKEFEKLKEEGLIRSIGVCNFGVEQLEDLKAQGLTTPVVNQIELHPHFPQKELREYGAANGIHTESWSPIGGSKGSLLSEQVLIDIGEAHGKSAAQVAIRWHIQNGLIVIPKSSNPERIAQNIDVFDFELTDEEMKAIDGLETGQRGGPDPATMNIH